MIRRRMHRVVVVVAETVAPQGELFHAEILEEQRKLFEGGERETSKKV